MRLGRSFHTLDEEQQKQTRRQDALRSEKNHDVGVATFYPGNSCSVAFFMVGEAFGVVCDNLKI